jgi:3-phosphoshikimate 1-carboxyvinyltransferase
MTRYRITYSGRTLQGSVDLPGSKSVAVRLLLMKELSGSGIVIRGLPDNEDTLLMVSLLNRIRNYKGQSGDGIITIDCGNTGTVYRFLTSYLAVTPGRWLLTGSGRMKQRPVKDLADTLKGLGADIDYAGIEGYPPLIIRGKRFEGHEATLQSDTSSQFVSSLLMVGPLLPGGLDLHLTGKAVSVPYIEMTLALMRQCGIRVEVTNDGYKIPHQEYTLAEPVVEKDWSAASSWFEIMAIAEEGQILLKDLTEHSLQGDNIMVKIYSELGVDSSFTPEGLYLRKNNHFCREFHLDLKNSPDIVPSLAVTLAAKKCLGNISGIEHLRIKESDRILSIRQELAIAGFPVEVNNNTLIFNALQYDIDTPATFSSHDDHRIAMAIAPLALKFKELIIENPNVVEKSYPTYWEDLQSIGFQVIEI